MAKGKGGFIGQDGLNAPDSPTDVSASGGDTQADVSFTSPSDVGGSAITGYRVTDSTGAHGATGSSSPVTVTGLTNGTSYTFNVWAINAFGCSSPSDATDAVTPALALGTFAGGYGSGDILTNIIDYINFSSTGNATDFGDLLAARRSHNQGSVSSSSRGIYGGGATGSDAETNQIQYITFASTGNATDYGDLTQTRETLAGCSSSTRGIFAGGYKGTPDNTNYNIIDYITIASTGNATDFGDLLNSIRQLGGAGSSTRGVFAGGRVSSDSDVIQYITIASTGNATDFGNLIGPGRKTSTCSNSTRMLMGAIDWAYGTNTIEYITIASTGNSIDFGDLTISQSGRTAVSSSTYGVFGGGESPYSNVIDYVTIATSGNASDWGDLTAARGSLNGSSSAHGGLA